MTFEIIVCTRGLVLAMRGGNECTTAKSFKGWKNGKLEQLLSRWKCVQGFGE